MSIQYKKHETYPDSILIRNFEGRVNVDDIINSWEHLINSHLLGDEIKGVINNLNGCNLVMDLDSFDRLITFLKSQNKLKGIKLAVICDSPEKIIFPILGKEQAQELKIEPFSTLDAAVKWII